MCVGGQRRIFIPPVLIKGHSKDIDMVIGDNEIIIGRIFFLVDALMLIPVPTLDCKLLAIQDESLLQLTLL